MSILKNKNIPNIYVDLKSILFFFQFSRENTKQKPNKINTEFNLQKDTIFQNIA